MALSLLQLLVVAKTEDYVEKMIHICCIFAMVKSVYHIVEEFIEVEELEEGKSQTFGLV